MRELQGPAYVLRRPHPDLRAAMAAFHRTAGLAVVRDTEHGQFFAAGDTWGIKTVPRSGPHASGDAELVPVLHTRDLAGAASRLRAAGPTTVLDSALVGPVVAVRAPDGGLLGIAGRAPDLPVPGDRLPDGGGAAPDLAGTRLVLRRTGDPAAVTAFYRDVVGLRAIGGTAVDLGEGVAMEMTTGGCDRGPVRARDDGPDGLMLRVHGIDGLLRRLERRGVRWLEPPHTFPTGTTVAYVADPGGVVLCLAERAPYPGNSEDVVAHDRWAALDTR